MSRGRSVGLWRASPSRPSVNGFVPISRTILLNQLPELPHHYRSVYATCAAMQNHREWDWLGETYPAGSFGTSLHHLADSVGGITVEQLRGALRTLAKYGLVQHTPKNKAFTIIHVIDQPTSSARSGKRNTGRNTVRNKPRTIDVEVKTLRKNTTQHHPASDLASESTATADLDDDEFGPTPRYQPDVLSPDDYAEQQEDWNLYASVIASLYPAGHGEVTKKFLEFAKREHKKKNVRKLYLRMMSHIDWCKDNKWAETDSGFVPNVPSFKNYLASGDWNEDFGYVESDLEEEAERELAEREQADQM
jgi:hypothetical protein